MARSILLTLTVLGPLLGGIAAGRSRTVPTARRAAGTGVVAGLTAAAALFTIALTGEAAALHLGDDAVLLADRLGALLAVFVLSMTGLVLAYASRYLACDPAAGGFAARAGLLAAASVGVVLAADLWVLAVAWALVSLTTVRLVRHDGAEPARIAARRTSIRFAFGDVALLAAAVVATSAWGGRLPLDEAAQAATIGDDSAVAGLVAALAVVAAVTRGALLPAHRWLAGTLHAPTPVSALLHAGVVNAGGLLLIRLSPALRESTAATSLAVALAVATMVVGIGASRTRVDVKGSLVWSTSAQMGFMILQVALGLVGPALVHLMAHGMYKANLFLGAGGAVDRAIRPRVHHRARARHAALGLFVGGAAVYGALVVLDPPGATTGPGWVMALSLAALLAVVVARLATTHPVRDAARLVALASLIAPAYLVSVTFIEDDLLGAPHRAAAGATALALAAVTVTALGWWLVASRAGISSAPGRVAWSWLLRLSHPCEVSSRAFDGRVATRPARASAPASATSDALAAETSAGGAAWQAA